LSLPNDEMISLRRFYALSRITSFAKYASTFSSQGTIACPTLKGKNLDDMFSINEKELRSILDISHSLKKRLRLNPSSYTPLVGRSMAMIFQKRSTRTRVSTESGFAQLGGHAIFLGSEDIQLGKNESMLDTAKTLSRFNDVILARVYKHDDIVELCKHSTVPVINALSDAHHPLQGLADLMTIEQHLRTTEGRTIAWIGDGNNILQTFLTMASIGRFHVRYATPKNYEPNSMIVDKAIKNAVAVGVSITATNDPLEAVKGADVVVTDTWVSMGMEKEELDRKKAFSGYQVTEDLCKRGGAKNDWKFLHCMPRKKEEVSDEVFYSSRSLVFDEAENRKWTVMAITLAQLLGGADL
jgi:ornithine carbamoyltransferase